MHGTEVIMSVSIKRAKWGSLAMTGFVLGTAIFTVNPGLFVLAGLSGASSAALWAKDRKGD